MAQLAVIPGSATAWPGERQSGATAAGVGEAAPPRGPHTLSRSRGCGAPATGEGGGIKRPW